jgi:hypothetical protein
LIDYFATSKYSFKGLNLNITFGSQTLIQENYYSYCFQYLFDYLLTHIATLKH